MASSAPRSTSLRPPVLIYIVDISAPNPDGAAGPGPTQLAALLALLIDGSDDAR